jgi:pimeloyl-ACP methyl ester carboxylesterase
MIALLVHVASATPAFDPSTPAERFEGPETWTQTEDVRLWNAIERWEDLEPGLFTQPAYNSGIAWADTDVTPWIATAFDDPTPHSSQFLLHVGLHEPTAKGTPILMVPGAGDNGSRGFITMATRMDRLNRPVYALTFAHPHDDVFMHAEAIADAIAVITARTGAEQVDLVAHSKGGIAATVYASHHNGAAWGRPDYAQYGTPYRGDIRRLLLIATPLGGVDTTYRWSSLSLFSVDPDTAIAPTAWSTYYPNTSAVPLVKESLADQDMLPDGADYFPGQRQLLAPLDELFALPGSQSWLGIYALQTDWYTTYEGGTGLLSKCEGIDAAIAAGGGLIERLEDVGVDPSVEIFLLAGDHPIMPNGDDDLAASFANLSGVIDYADLFDKATDRGTPITVSDDELTGIERGDLVVGELTGPSDGLVFVRSALKEEALNARGAVVIEAKTAGLSHLDLLYASPITGQLLVDAADAGGDAETWARGVGERYTREDTLGWVEGVLSDPAQSGDTGDTGTVQGTRPTLPGNNPDEFARPCGGCRSAEGPVLGFLGLLPLVALRRRKK